MVCRRCMSCWRPYWGPTGWRARCAIDLVICGATAGAGIVGTWVQRRLQATAPGAAHSSWDQYNRTGSAEALAMPAYPQCLSITRCMCIFHATDRLDSVEAPALGLACAARLAQGPSSRSAVRRVCFQSYFSSCRLLYASSNAAHRDIRSSCSDRRAECLCHSHQACLLMPRCEASVARALSDSCTDWPALAIFS